MNYMINNILQYIPYMILIIFIIIILIIAFIRIKFKFWALQPVFHIYDIGYMFFPPGVIFQDLPCENKYCNFKNIETIKYNDISDFKIEKFVNFINLNYLQNKENIFSPKKENVVPYFSNHNSMSLFSFYTEPINLMDLKKNNVIEDTKIIGVMTTRPINIQINNSNTNINDSNFIAYYVDYLCVDKTYRKKGVAPQIIQTHHYNQRRLNKNVYVSLFKREGQLTGIVPLCAYYTYGFSVNKWGKPKDINASYKLLEITPQNIHLLVDYIKSNSHNFDIVASVDIANIIELIKTKNIFIYSIFSGNTIKSAYFYRKTCTSIEKKMEVLCCFASINTCENVEDFIQGFKCSFWKTADKNMFGFASVENISHNNLLIKHLLIRNHPIIVSPTAYFFYNFAYHTFSPKMVLFIN